MKQEEVVKLSDSELKDKLFSLKKTYANLKRTHAVTPLENPIQLKINRRFIARIYTEINKRRIKIIES